MGCNLMEPAPRVLAIGTGLWDLFWVVDGASGEVARAWVEEGKDGRRGGGRWLWMWQWLWLRVWVRVGRVMRGSAEREDLHEGGRKYRNTS